MLQLLGEAGAIVMLEPEARCWRSVNLRAGDRQLLTVLSERLLPTFREEAHFSCCQFWYQGWQNRRLPGRNMNFGSMTR